MKKIYKYGTGEEIPKGAFYLTTLVENVTDWEKEGEKDGDNIIVGKSARLVWHYFLVEVE